MHFADFPRRGLFVATVLVVAIVAFHACPAFAQGDSTPPGSKPYRAVIVTVERQADVDGQPVFQYTLRFLEGPQRGQTVTVGDNEAVTSVGGIFYHPKDRVLAYRIDKVDGTTGYLITDAYRLPSLAWLIGLFVLGVAWFSRWHGIRSLLGLAVSIAMLVLWLVPMIASGAAPVPVTIAGSAAVLIVGILLTEGLRKLSYASILATVVTMLIIGLLSAWSIHFTALTGNDTEEAFYLQANTSTPVDVRGLLLAGIIIGTLGLLEDVAIAQVATVAELRRAKPKASRWAIYRSAQRVGQTHMGAIINTLALAYGGAALPLLILFSAGQSPVPTILNGELISTEIVRTIVGTLGLLLALPISTLIAVLLNVVSEHEIGEEHHVHTHG